MGGDPLAGGAVGAGEPVVGRPPDEADDRVAPDAGRGPRVGAGPVGVPRLPAMTTATSSPITVTRSLTGSLVPVRPLSAVGARRVVPWVSSGRCTTNRYSSGSISISLR